MAAPPLGSLGTAHASIAKHAELARGQGVVWVLEDGRGRQDDAAIAIAERLGAEFRRLTLAWSWQGMLAGLGNHGSLAGLRTGLPLAQAIAPALTLSNGMRGASVAAWLKSRAGSTMVHCGAAGGHAAAIDLHVLDAAREIASCHPSCVFPVLGPPHRLSPLALAGLRRQWRDRLEHLPRPWLGLIVGHGPFRGELQPSEAFHVGQRLAAAARTAGGTVLAATGPHTGREAADALGAGLTDCLHLLYRAGEPGEDATPGFIASADVIVLAGNASDRLLQACATTVPVYVAIAGPLTGRMRRLSRRLAAAGQVRLLSNSIESWSRTALDEAGRVANAIRARCLV